MSNVLCFGEFLLRLSPALNSEWIRQAQMPVFVGGAELNVARALAKWGEPVAYCTALPDNYLSKELVSFIAQNGIETSKINYSGSRIGTYYLPQGADLKSAGTVYDRAHSAFWELKPGVLNWDEILRDVSWFHFSAISPALNGDVAAVCLEGAKAASGKGLTVSVDLNYRSKLWQYGKMPADVMPPLVAHCDVVMGNIWSAHTMLGTPIDEAIHENAGKEKYLVHAKKTAEAIQQNFPKCKAVANTFRFDAGEQFIQYFSSLYTAGQSYNSATHFATDVKDRSGSGDCYMAGLIYGFRHRFSPQQTVDFATSAAVGKLQEKGDATQQTVEAIRQRMNNVTKDSSQAE
jgi:2-dehydro-3-deoxygluconokinase